MDYSVYLVPGVVAFRSTLRKNIKHQMKERGATRCFVVRAKDGAQFNCHLSRTGRFVMVQS